MAQKSPVATFKKSEMAALFGLTTKDKGVPTFHTPEIVTVEFKTATAEHVSVSMFDITEPKAEVVSEATD